MPLTIACPQCHKSVKVAEHLQGKKIQCPACKGLIAVPAPEGVAVAAVQPRSPAPADDLALLVPGHASPLPGEKTFKRCSTCGHDVPQDTVLCTNCGFNFSTGKNVQGFTVKQRGRSNFYLGTALRSAFFVAVIGVGGYLVYYAIYKDNLGEHLSHIGQSDEPVNNSRGGASDRNPAAPTTGAPAQSLLVVVNQRFPLVDVFGNDARIGQAQHGQTEKIVVAPPAQEKPLKISFEVKNLPREVRLHPELVKILNEGLKFTGSAAAGMQIVLRGPPLDLLPKAGEVIRGLKLDPQMYDSTTKTGKVKSFTFRGCLLKAPSANGVLHLGVESKGTGVDLTWIEQDCIIEKEGKEVYNPNLSPIESKSIKIVAASGKVDVAP